MKKLILLLCLIPYSVFAQNYSATVIDSDSIAWANGNYILSLDPPGTTPVVTGSLDGSGHFAFTLPSTFYTRWNLTVCPNASAPCGTYNFTNMSGTFDLSSIINAIIVAPRFKPVSGAYGYADVEAQLSITPGSVYWNVTSSCSRTWNGSTWTCPTAGIGVPSGMTAFISSGICPSGWTENDSLAGNYILATTHAAGDVGTTGGSASFTPSGTVTAPAFTGAAATLTGTVSAPVFTGTVATLTGSISTPVFSGSSDNVAFGVISFAGGSDAVSFGTIGFSGGTDNVSFGTIAFAGAADNVAFGTITFAGSVDTTSSVSAGTPAGTNANGTIAWPTPVPTFAGALDTTSSTGAGTPAGTNGATATTGNCASTNIAAGTGSTTACKATAPNLTVPAETFTGSALAGHTHTVTPTGTVAWPTGGSSVPTETAGAFTGSALAGHTHTVTPTGTVSIATSTVTPTGTVSIGTSTVTPTGTVSIGASTVVPTGTVSIGTSTVTPTGTNSTPSLIMNSYTPGGTNSTPSLSMNSYTPSGTNSTPSFSGTPGTVTPVFYKMIPCVKN